MAILLTITDFGLHTFLKFHKQGILQMENLRTYDDYPDLKDFPRQSF